MPVISQWANGWHGLDALAHPTNLLLGFAVFFLSRLLGTLYLINNIRSESLVQRSRRQLVVDGIPFLLLFLAFVAHVLLKVGFAVQPETGEIAMEPFKYFNNLIAMPYLLVLFLVGVVGVLFGLGKSIFCKTYTRGIWFAGVGTVLTVLALLLTVGYNHTAYYPSTADLQSSLTLSNSCMPVISQWANGWHGLDALAHPTNLLLGFAVFFLSRLLGTLYFINNIRILHQ